MKKKLLLPINCNSKIDYFEIRVQMNFEITAKKTKTHYNSKKITSILIPYSFQSEHSAHNHFVFLIKTVIHKKVQAL